MTTDELPGGPWRWERVDPGAIARRHPPSALFPEADRLTRQLVGPQGWAILAADGAPVLLHDSGWGTVELPSPIPDGQVAGLLARAWEIPRLEAAVREARDWAIAGFSSGRDDAPVRAQHLGRTPPDWLAHPRRERT